MSGTKKIKEYEMGDLLTVKTRSIGSFCERSKRARANAKVWFGGKKSVQYREEKYFWKVSLYEPWCL